MARNGKIARLPLHIRNELNKRLSDGESGVKLVKWVNEEVRFFLRDNDESRRLRITEQNLSEWRQGGYQDWLRHEEAREFLKNLAEQAGEMEEAADGKSICDRFGALLAVDLARLAKKFLEQETDDEKRWARLKEISRELSRLRRDEHRAVWTYIKREQWEHQREREEEETIRQEERRKHVAALFSVRQARATDAANLAQKIKSNPPSPRFPRTGQIKPKPTDPSEHRAVARPESKDQTKAQNPSESDQIQRNPTKNVARSEPVGPMKCGKAANSKTDEVLAEQRLGAPVESDQIQPNPTKNVAPSKPDAPSGASPKPGRSEHTSIPADSNATRTDNMAAPGTGALRPNPTKSDQSVGAPSLCSARIQEPNERANSK